MSGTVGTIQGLISRIGPWFLHQKNIGRFLESFGLHYDSAALSLQQGAMLANPLKCDASALPQISIDRSMRLFDSESELSKRTRLADWHALHRQRGTNQGEIRHALPYFLPDTPIMRIVHQDGAALRATWHTISLVDGAYDVTKTEPSNWNYDGLTPEWSRFWVILYVPSRLLNLHRYDDGTTYDDGTLWDGVVTQIAKDMVDMILEWQSTTERMQAYILATDPASFDPAAVATFPGGGSMSTLPVGNWGSPIDPRTGRMGRLSSAIWLYEAGPG